MNRNLELLVTHAKQLRECLTTLTAIEKDIDDAGTNTSQLADIAFVCRETSDAIDDIRKSIDKLKAKAESDACILLTMFNRQNIQTDMCTATPNPSIMYRFPQRRSEQGFDMFMAILLSDQRKAIVNEWVRPHFPTLQDSITKAIAEGKNPPFGITPDKLIGSIGKLRIRGKAKIL